MISEGHFDVQGQVKTMRDFEIKQKVAATAVAQES
jgi:hypothetical protein